MSELESVEPAEIFAEMDAQPPLVRQQAAAIYLDREVCWSLRFANATEPNQGQAHLIFRFDPYDIRMVVGDILLSEYPSMMGARVEENVLVRGRIRKIDNLCIKLEIHDLVLPRTAESAR